MGEQGIRRAEQRGPLTSERGTTRIEDSVVQKIAGIAAQEIEGVRLGGAASERVGGLLSSVPGVGGGGAPTRGVSVEVGEVEAAVDLTVRVAYGLPVPRVSEAVRRNVVNRIENLTGLRVTEVNVYVADVFFPQEENGQQQG